MLPHFNKGVCGDRQGRILNRSLSVFLAKEMFEIGWGCNEESLGQGLSEDYDPVDLGQNRVTLLAGGSLLAYLYRTGFGKAEVMSR